MIPKFSFRSIVFVVTFIFICIVLFRSITFASNGQAKSNSRPHHSNTQKDTTKSRAVKIVPHTTHQLSGGKNIERTDTSAIDYDTLEKEAKVELIIQQAHTADVRDIAVSPDSNFFVSVADDNSIKIWNCDGQLIKSIGVHGTRFRHVAIPPDGKHIVVSSSSDEVHFYALNGQHIKTLKGEGYNIKFIKYSPDGKYILTSSGNGKVALRDPQWRLIKKIEAHNGNLTAMAVSPDGNFFATGSDTRTKTDKGWETFARLWDRKGSLIQELELKRSKRLGSAKAVDVLKGVHFIDFSPDGKKIALMAQHNDVHIRSLSGELEVSFKLNRITYPTACRFSPNGNYLMIPCGGNINIATLTGELRHPIVADPERQIRLECFDIAPDGSYFVASLGGWDKKLKGAIQLWDSKGVLVRRIQSSVEEINDVNLAPDHSKLILEQQRGKQSMVWNIANNAMRSLTGSIIYDQNGDRCYYNYPDNYKIDIQYHQSKQSFPTDGSSFFYFPVSFANILHLPSSAKGRIEFYDMEGQPLRQIDTYRHFGGMGGINFKSISPNGKYLIVETRTDHGGVHEITRIDLADGKPLNSIDIGHDLSAYAVGPHGDLIATGHKNGDIQLWTHTGEKRKEFKGHVLPITGIAISTDRKFLVSAAKDRTVRLWNMLTGKALTMVLFNNQEWFAFDENGYFDCSNGAREYARFVKGLSIYHFQQFWNDFFQPGLISLFLEGRSPEGIHIAQKLAAAPIVNLLPDEKIQETIDSATITLKVCAKPRSNGVGKIFLLHNGRAFDESSRGLVSATRRDCKTFTINLTPGKNVFVGAAYDQNNDIFGQSQKFNIVYQPKEIVKPNLYIIAVGVSEYADKNINLKYPSIDAVEVCKTLKGVGSTIYDNIYTVVLINQQAKKQTIQQHMRKTIKQAKTADTVVLYLAGHGETEEKAYYFLSHDADITDMPKTTLSIDEISQFVQRLSASKIAVFLDTCKSGAATKALGTLAMARSLEERRIIANLAKERGIAVFSAANLTQAAYEIQALGHGIFTYCMIDALQNKKKQIANNNLISISKLLGEVNRTTRDVAYEYLKIEQSPILYMFGDDFSIGAVQ